MPFTEITSYRECANRLLTLVSDLQQLDQRLGYSYQDARTAALRNCDAHTSSMVMVQKLLASVQEGLLPADVLRQCMELDAEAFQLAINRLSDTLRHGYVAIYQFQIENMLRNILLGLGPPAPPSGFYNIADAVLNRAGVPDPNSKRDILNVPALIRNSLHSNGIHHGYRGSSTHINLDGAQYDFIDGQPVNCAPVGHTSFSALEREWLYSKSFCYDLPYMD